MTSQPPDNHELLSGMLDGELSGAEARRIEQAMREDPALQDRLDELTAMRSSLLRGRPTGRLSKSFASNTVTAARQRAASMESEAPAWVPLSSSASEGNGRSTAKPKLEPSYRQRIWIPLGALASACGFALFAFLTLPRPEPQPIADLPPFNERLDPIQPSTAPDIPENAVASNPAAPTSEAPTAAREPDAPRPENVSPDRSDLRIAESPATPAKENRPEQFDRSSMPDTSSIPGTGSLASMDEIKEPRSARSPSEVSKAPFMLMVVSVSIDRVARENNALHRILNEHGIASIEDLALSPEQLDTLLSTGMAGSVSQNGAGVYFLKGYAKSLSSALDDICSQYKDFPEFGLNIAMDDSARTLIDQLDGIQVAANQGVARRLAAETPDGLVSTFAPGAKRSAPLSGKRREEFRSQATMPKSDLNPISHLLLIVRDAD